MFAVVKGGISRAPDFHLRTLASGYAKVSVGGNDDEGVRMTRVRGNLAVSVRCVFIVHGESDGIQEAHMLTTCRMLARIYAINGVRWHTEPGHSSDGDAARIREEDTWER